MGEGIMKKLLIIFYSLLIVFPIMGGESYINLTAPTVKLSIMNGVSNVRNGTEVVLNAEGFSPNTKITGVIFVVLQTHAKRLHFFLQRDQR